MYKFDIICRNVGLGISSSCSRIGGMVAPQFLLLSSFYPGLPLIMFGSLAIVTAVLALLLPETKGRSLPQDFEDALELTKGNR